MNKPLLLTVLVLASVQGFAAKPLLNPKVNSAVSLPACDEQINKLHTFKNEVVGGLKALPKGLLVAREARFYVESRTEEGTKTQVQSYQSFVKSKTVSKAKIVCGNSDTPLKNRFSMMAPTLIHNNSDSRANNIFWQFQVLAEDKTLSPWNTKSLALSSKEDLEKTLTRLGYESKVYQLPSSKYEIVYSQKQADKSQVISIIYDLD